MKAASRRPGAAPPALVATSAVTASTTRLAAMRPGSALGGPLRQTIAEISPMVNTSCHAIGLKNQAPGSGQFGKFIPKAREAM